MLDRDQMFLPMLDAYPDFAGIWDDFNAYWSDRPDSKPYYLLMSDLVVDCSRMLAAGETVHVARVLDVVERWQIEGDPYVKEAAIVGFLEDLQNANLHKGTAPEDFVPFLGPESLYWWQKVSRFWSHGERIVDDR